MKVGITGASGFIGNHLLDEFKRRDWTIRVLQHQSRISKDFPCEVVVGDIRDSSSVHKFLEGLDMVFHLAAALGASLIAKEEFAQINTEGTKNVLKAAKEAGVQRVIHFSSAGVLGAVTRGDVAEEEYPAQPKNVYDRTKLMAEKIVRGQATGGMDVVTIRPGWVYGPGDRRTFKLIRAIARGRFMLVTRGEAKQTPVYIDDLVRGVMLCAERGKAGEIYHIAGEEALQVREIVETIASATGRHLPRLTLPLFPIKLTAQIMEKTFLLFKKEAPLTTGRLAFFIHPKPLSIIKAKEELGFLPQTDFTTGITQTVAWYREHGWL
ncbi:NAD-dependent epimerase/dehydratase family protein [Acidobacteriota bacterium]